MKNILCALLCALLPAGCNHADGNAVVLFPTDVSTVEVTYGVYSSDTSRELNEDEISAVKEWVAALQLQSIDFENGETPSEVYAGGESYKFNVNNGEISF